MYLLQKQLYFIQHRTKRGIWINFYHINKCNLFTNYVSSILHHCNSLLSHKSIYRASEHLIIFVSIATDYITIEEHSIDQIFEYKVFRYNDCKFVPSAKNL